MLPTSTCRTLRPRSAPEPELRVVCLKRDCEEVVDSFGRWLDRTLPLSCDHWTASPGFGRHHDPIWTHTFPTYDEPDRSAGIRRYWNEYYSKVDDLQERFPERIRVFPMSALNDVDSQRQILGFCGFSAERQIVDTKIHRHQPKTVKSRRLPDRSSDDPARCAVIVMSRGGIEPQCEASLRVLEKRGFPVVRACNYAVEEKGRSRLATRALMRGFAEIFWIDPDIAFNPDDVERLRAHVLPLVCGLYPDVGQRGLACKVLPGQQQLKLGGGGRLTEIQSAAMGFFHMRREVLERIQLSIRLPVANELTSEPSVPFFQSATGRFDDGYRLLTGHEAFCERARQCGIPIMADTTIRLRRFGQIAYTWEDAGSHATRQRPSSTNSLRLRKMLVLHHWRRRARVWLLSILLLLSLALSTITHRKRTRRDSPSRQHAWADWSF